MNVLIACDKFKGSLSAIDVCNAVHRGLEHNYPNADYHLHPMADGGDGSLLVLEQYLDTTRHTVDTIDPLGRPIKASYLVDRDTAYIELAEASGITLLKEGEKNPLITSTVGTGVLVQDAIDKAYKKIIFLLGGSCTNDAGLGIAHAIGFEFIDDNGKAIIPTGGNLQDIKVILPPDNLQDIRFSILSDVTNPFYGPTGAAQVYARQKGADDQMVAYLDEGLQYIADFFIAEYQIDVQSIPGSGSAGGIAGGLHALLGAEILNGFDQLAEISQLDHKIANADLIISGEGKLDLQSLDGKVIGKMAALCKAYKKPFIAMVGSNELTQIQLQEQSIEQVLSIMDVADNLEDGIINTAVYIEQLSRSIINNFTA